MPTDEINARGCPIRNQTGAVGVQHFEAERAERQRELATFLATAGYQT